MEFSKRAIGIVVVVVVVSVAALPGCVSDGEDTPAEEENDPAPGVSVVVPTERLTPFCQTMTELSDRLRSNEPVGDDVIVQTYRSIRDEVPVEIADDFALVLQALETGAPAPTDPPRPTIQTVPDSSSPATTAETGTGTTVPGSSPVTSAVVDERFVRDSSPAERINSYVSFTCRDSDNNPGPPATQPLDEPASSDDG